MLHLLRRLAARISARTAGNIMAGAVSGLLAIVARTTDHGMTVLMMFMAALFGWCSAWRFLTGSWPGDEEEGEE